MASLWSFLKFVILISNVEISVGRPPNPDGSTDRPGTQCVNTNNQCRRWAKEGACMTNWVVMAAQCRKSCGFCDTEGQTALYDREKKLKKRLLAGQDITVRPMKNTSDTINVAISFSLLHLMNVDEAKQTVTVQGYLKMKWFDSRLKWEPSQHGEVERLSLGASEIWHPSIMIVNTADADKTFFLTDNPTPVMVNNEGVAVWTPRVEATSLCNFDVKYFPVDTHSCTLTLGPWLQDGSLFDLTIWQIDDDGNIPNPHILPNQKWKITTNLRAADDFITPCCSEPWPVVHVEMEIQRHAPMMSVVVITPVVYVIVTLLLCFLLPIRSVIRFLFAGGDCVISIFLLQLLSGKIPEASSSPPVVVQITAALIIESLLIMIWCGMLYHLTSPRCKTKLKQLPVRLMKTVRHLAPNFHQNGLQDNSSNYWRLEEPQIDLVDAFFGTDDGRAPFLNHESTTPKSKNNSHAHEASEPSEPNGQVPSNHDNENVTVIPQEPNVTSATFSNIHLAKLLNYIGLAVFTTIFFIEFIVLLVV